MYTLVRQSPKGPPEFTKALIVCPASLVKNWEKEVEKWIGTRLNVVTVEGGGKDAISERIQKYRYHPMNQPIVLIISYESFRMNVESIALIQIGLIICDEGHRLKNQDNQIYQALCNLTVQRRILISGTPIQNDLLEYFSLVHFVNQGILGTRNEFKRNYENPILSGRDALATDKEREIGDQKLKELLQIVNRCIIRRTCIHF
uniref:DNA repair and recombination protein RAD54-like (Trinotate prediction) n=1 Tax=Henneguya salminicola TaxID=69463 RepID=A0A6G3MG25_HENSL